MLFLVHFLVVAVCSMNSRTGTPSSACTGENAGGENLDNGSLCGNGYTGEASIAPANTGSAPGLQDFYERDAFICQTDGCLI